MAISDMDIKLLWGKAAGLCSKPDCRQDLTLILQQSGPVTIGEMAHVIAESPKGPRGSAGSRDNINDYANLILLCPTHHTLVDKAHADYPANLLRQWKKDHEHFVANRIKGEEFATKEDLFNYALKLLAENLQAIKIFGPNSVTARRSPFGEGIRMWDLRKTELIIPNNTRIVNSFRKMHAKLNPSEWAIFSEFQEHANAFEQSTYSRLEMSSQPRFPSTFEKMLETSHA